MHWSIIPDREREVGITSTGGEKGQAGVAGTGFQAALPLAVAAVGDWFIFSRRFRVPLRFGEGVVASERAAYGQFY